MDASVAIPLLVASHEAHGMVVQWAAGRSLALSGHALAETYSVLTRLPGDARVAAGDAVALIDSNFGRQLPLAQEIAPNIHRELAERGVEGGAVDDGLVALAALGEGAALATRDARARSTYEALGVTVELI